MVQALSPFVAVCSTIAVRSLSLASLISLPMLLLAVRRRRFWCRRLCPVGLISEYCGKARVGRDQRNKPATSSRPWPPGRFIVLATLGGALVGYPFLLWMDPLALFSAAFGVFRISGPGMSLLSMAGLPIVMVISVLFPGIWCSRICPLGATQDLLAQAARWPNRSKTTGREMLPGAEIQERRVFLTLGAGTLFSAIVPRAWAEKQHQLRPPGNVDETAFKGGCIRCGSCLRACPTGIIESAGRAGDVAGFLAPSLRFSGPNYCLQDCNRCGKVCPTGVIRPLPLEEKNRHVIGIAAIDLTRCLLTLEVECGVCVPRCPRGAIVEGFARETYTAVVKVVPENCNGCGACVGICPPKVVKVEAKLRSPSPL
jgi:ferredoxin